MEEIFQHAVKLLRRRDYTAWQLRQKLTAKFGHVPDEVLQRLMEKRFLDDRRYAVNFVSKDAQKHRSRIREELLLAGIAEEIVDYAIQTREWPSLRDVVKARMNALHLHAPLHRREAARLFRALNRLGYQEDEIREELEQLHEQ